MARINKFKKYECFLLLLLSIAAFIIIVRYFLSDDNKEGLFGRRGGRRGNPFRRMINRVNRVTRNTIPQVNRHNPYQSQANSATNEFNRKQNELRRLRRPTRNMPKRPPDPKLGPPQRIRYGRPNTREQSAMDAIRNFPLEVVKPINEVGRATVNAFNELEKPINAFKDAINAIDLSRALKVFDVIPKWLSEKRKREVKKQSVYESSSTLAQSIKNEAQRQITNNLKRLGELDLKDMASEALEGAESRLKYTLSIADNTLKSLELQKILKSKKNSDDQMRSEQETRRKNMNKIRSLT